MVGYGFLSGSGSGLGTVSYSVSLEAPDILDSVRGVIQINKYNLVIQLLFNAINFGNFV